MYEVGVVEHFEAAHSLKGDFGPATRKHGHTYRVELVVRGESLRQDNTLCDIGQLGDALRAALAPLHFRDLDELPAFSGRNTTAEVVAEHLLEEVATGVDHSNLKAIAVRVWESPTAYAAAERVLKG